MPASWRRCWRRASSATCRGASGCRSGWRRSWPRRATSRTCSTCCGAGPTTSASAPRCTSCAACPRRRPAPPSCPTSPRWRCRPWCRGWRRSSRGGTAASPQGGLALLAMGKLGGREMTIRSDLDLIMIYDAGADQMSDGEKPIGPMVYYTRLIQRLISAITAPTAQGALFEVDMRLRPSGNAGPLATSLEAFSRLSARRRLDLGAHGPDPGPGDPRRRPAARADRGRDRRRCWGCPATRTSCAATSPRCAAGWRASATTGDVWNIKHFRGGLVDIEFIAQYLQLRHAADRPEILHQATAEVLRRADGGRRAARCGGGDAAARRWRPGSGCRPSCASPSRTSSTRPRPPTP